MTIIIKIIAATMTLLGLVAIVSPITFKLWLKSLEAGKWPAAGVSINLLAGIALLILAGKCEITWIPLFIGISFTVKALLFLAYGPKRLIMKASIWLERRSRFIRVAGIVHIAVGIMLMLSV
jgi:hypothetical protein